jgi:hypothetical protein
MAMAMAPYGKNKNKPESTEHFSTRISISIDGTYHLAGVLCTSVWILDMTGRQLGYRILRGPGSPVDFLAGVHLRDQVDALSH